MRYNKPRRNTFRSNHGGFRRNGAHELRTNITDSISKRFYKGTFSNNGYKAEKLLEKYNNLAKEALSNGNEILSESYYQHADHFLRVIENRNSIQNNSKTDMNNSSKEKNSDDKIILKDEKDSSFQQPQNSEEI